MLVTWRRWIEGRRTTQLYRRSKQNSVWWWIFGAEAWKPWHRFISFLQQCHACWDVKDFCIQAWLFVCPWNASEYSYVLEFLMASVSDIAFSLGPHRWLSYLTGYGGFCHEEGCPDSGVPVGGQVWCSIITSAHEIKMSLKCNTTEDQIPVHINEHITLKSVCLDWCSKMVWFVSQKVSLSQRSGWSCLAFCFSGLFPAPAFLSSPRYSVQVHLTHLSLGVFWKADSDTFASSGKCFYERHCEISQSKEVDFLGLLTLTLEFPFASSCCYLGGTDLRLHVRWTCMTILLKTIYKS